MDKTKRKCHGILSFRGYSEGKFQHYSMLKLQRNLFHDTSCWILV